MNKCQAPGLECEECRLKCQLPLIEAEKAQRERVMNKQRDYEKDWQEFCLTDGLTEKEMKMRGYLRYWMFEYSLLKADLNRLQVALEATIKEKEQYKRAFEEICHQFNFGDEKDYQAMHDTFLELARKGGEK